MRSMVTPTRRGKALGLTAAASATALLVAACANTGNDAATAARSFTFSIASAPTALDVTKDAGYGGMIYGAVNDLLEDLGANGSLTPALATSVTTPDDTTIVYHLRENVRFSDGTPLTAQDVVWSLQHDVASGSVVSSFFGGVKDVTRTGADEVTVRLSHPDPTARELIGTFGFVYRAAQGQAHPKDFGTPAAVPVGTGPYRITSDTTNGVTLERNPNYWGHAPALNQIRFVYIAQDNTAQLAMRSGSIQAALVASPQTITQWKAVSGARLYPMRPAAVEYLSMDVTSPPFNDVHVRRAIAYAVDRSGLVQAVFHGESEVAPSVVDAEMISGVAPSAAGTDAFLRTLPRYGFDLAKAKAELAQSAYPNGFTTNLPYQSTDGASGLIVQNLQHALGSIGITIEAKPLTATDWVTQLNAHKDLGMQITSISGPGPNDPGGTIGIMVGKANATADGFNYANYYPPAVENALATLTQSTDKSARWRATRDILTAVATDLPYVPVFDSPQLVVVGGGFHLPDAGIYQTAVYNTGQWVFAVH